MNESTHDFLAAAAVLTNEQRITAAVEQVQASAVLIHADLERIETRLFAYINSLKTVTGPGPGGPKIDPKKK